MRQLALILFLLLYAIRGASEPEAPADQLPRIPTRSPQAALEAFEIRPGLSINLAAHEPLVIDPIDACFDENGRLFVVEMIGYSEHRDDRLGRIRMLTDDNDDGVFDRASVYAKDLRWPSAVQCFDGGVFVIATPDLYYFKDLDGDGIAETQETVFTGFGQGVSRLNMQALANSLRWGPDNRIWGATAGTGGKVGAVGGPTVNLKGQDFSFDPRTRALRAENGTAQYGLSFDSIGRRFVCSNSKHLMAVMWERAWTRKGPHFSLPKPLVSIAVDGGAAPVYRISPDEPWRIVRTRWRVSGVVRGMVEGGGRVSGYFTGASGVHIYTGDALGPEFTDNAFTGDVGSNLLHRKIIHRNRVQAEARRPEDEKEMEFLASTDNWFRPVTSLSGPDGCLYVLDMCRETIEHPWSLPPGIKKHLDLDSGNDRGRIFRIQPESSTRRKTPKLKASSNDELAALLDHPNSWHRRTAQRLLFERGDDRAGAGWGKPPDPGSVDGPFRRALAYPLKGYDDENGLLELATTEDPWMEAAVLNAIQDPRQALKMFEGLTSASVTNRNFLTKLARLIGTSGTIDQVQQVLHGLAKAERFSAIPVLQALASSPHFPTLMREQADLRKVFDQARTDARGKEISEAQQVDAIHLLRFDPDPRTTEELKRNFTNPRTTVVKLALMESLIHRKAPGIVELLIEHCAGDDARVRAAAKNYLLGRSDGVQALFKAMDADKNVWRLSPHEIEQLQKHPNKSVRALALKRFPLVKKESRAAVITRYLPALKLKGDPARGKLEYRARCMICHAYRGEGFTVGPELVTFKAAGSESNLINLIDPNREVAPQYQAYQFELNDDSSIIGLIAYETTTEITIRQPFGTEKTYARKEIKSMKSLGHSLMPEGLEMPQGEAISGMSVQDMTDLLAFIATAE